MGSKNALELKADIPNDSLRTPPPYATRDNCQSYDVDYRQWRRGIAIVDPSGQDLYASRTPHSYSSRLEIVNRNGEVIGFSKRSNVTSRIDIEVAGAAGDRHSFEVHNTMSVLGGSPKYTSPAFGGSDVTWKNKAMSTRIIYTLVDGRGIAVAHFESDPRSRVGKLDLTDEVVGEERMNEVAVTLLTLLHRKIVNIHASWIAAVT